MLKRKYQIFIGSTYQDLKEESDEVIKAILKDYIFFLWVWKWFMRIMKSNGSKLLIQCIRSINPRLSKTL